MDYQKIIENDFYVNPTLTGFGTLPPFLDYYISKMKVVQYNGKRPSWIPSTEKMREFLMESHWGGEYKSRSLSWVIGHNGTPLSQDSIQIDHIMTWEEIGKKLLYEYNGINAQRTPFRQLTTLPHSDGKLKKGIDYIDDPDVLKVFGPDVLYRFTNIAAIKYFHTIENLRPLPGSINSKRNNTNLTDKDLNIVHPKDINIHLLRKLAELSASVEEYTTQVVQLTQTYSDPREREIHIQMFLEKTDEIISHLYDVNRSEFI